MVMTAWERPPGGRQGDRCQQSCIRTASRDDVSHEALLRLRTVASARRGRAHGAPAAEIADMSGERKLLRRRGEIPEAVIHIERGLDDEPFRIGADDIVIADALVGSAFWRRLARNVTPVVFYRPKMGRCLHRANGRTAEPQCLRTHWQRLCVYCRRQTSVFRLRLTGRGSRRNTRGFATSRRRRGMKTSPPLQRHRGDEHDYEPHQIEPSARDFFLRRSSAASFWLAYCEMALDTLKENNLYARRTSTSSQIQGKA